MKKYIVRLTDVERETLNRLVKKKRVSSQKVRRAHVLLKADADGPNWTDVKIAEAFDCRTRSVEFIGERLVTEGFEIALNVAAGIGKRLAQAAIQLEARRKIGLRPSGLLRRQRWSAWTVDAEQQSRTILLRETAEPSASGRGFDSAVDFRHKGE